MPVVLHGLGPARLATIDARQVSRISLARSRVLLSTLAECQCTESDRDRDVRNPEKMLSSAALLESCECGLGVNGTVN